MTPTSITRSSKTAGAGGSGSMHQAIRLEGLENEAREAKKGLWADPHPVPQWEWRKRSRLVRAGVEREATRVGRQLPTPALPTEASYRSSVRVGWRYTPPSSRSPYSTKKNGATRAIVRMGRRTFWRAINCY